MQYFAQTFFNFNKNTRATNNIIYTFAPLFLMKDDRKQRLLATICHVVRHLFGRFWILKFILFPLGISVPFLFSIFIGLTLCVPFMAYYYVRMYRNMVCGGTISFLHAWIFTVFMYMFAALLTAVAHYIYIRFIDQGFILNSYETMLNSWEITYKAVPGIDAYIEQLREGLSQVRSLTPIEITMQMMSMNVFVGSLLAIPTALFVMKRPPADYIGGR